MCSNLIKLIAFVLLSSIHLIIANEFDNCCRYGFEDGVKLNMLRENRNWSVIRSQSFNFCEEKVMFGVNAFRKCKVIGEEMALNCQIGKYYSLLGFDCESLRDEHPSVYGCCLTCSNGKKFAEDQFDLIENRTSKLGDELFKNQNLYRSLLVEIDKGLDKQCELLNLVYLTPDLQFSTFRQCCRSWTYNYNQNFYPDHFSLSDTCERINICLDKQNHTQFNFEQIKNLKELARLKTENTLKIIQEQMKLENIPFINQFDEVTLRKDDGNARTVTELKLLDTNASSLIAQNFHRNRLRSLADERKFHSDISEYELQIRRVPADKFKYHYCNKPCKDIRRQDYSETEVNTNLIRGREFVQCFHNYSQQFCAKPIECQAGFMPNHNNTVCIELDECAQNLDDCLKNSEYCVNHYDGYTCECRQGYRYDLTKEQCVNIDECQEVKDLCPAKSYCIDLEGSFECKCYEGLFKDDNNQCSPYVNKAVGNQKKKPSVNEEEDNVLHFSVNSIDKDQTTTTDQSLEEERLLIERIKLEKQNLEKLRNLNLKDEKSTSDQIKPNENAKATKETDKTMDSLEKEISSTKSNPKADNKIDSKETNDDQTKSSNKQEEPSISPVRSESEAKNDLRTIDNEIKTEQPPSAQAQLDQFKDYNPCPVGYYLTEHLPRMCIDIDECSSSTLNKCDQNQTCVNLPGRYKCEPNFDCPKEYKDINLNVIGEQHHHEQSNRASTYCKYVHNREFKTDKERFKYEKEHSVIQYVSFDITTLPFSDDSDYEMIYKDKTLEKADGQRYKPTGIIVYILDKSLSKQKLNLNFKGTLEIKSTSCKLDNLAKHFKLTELSSNVFAIVLLESVKEECTIDFSLDIRSIDDNLDRLASLKDDTEANPNKQNKIYNRELYNLHLIIYRYQEEYTLKGNLRS